MKHNMIFPLLHPSTTRCRTILYPIPQPEDTPLNPARKDTEGWHVSICPTCLKTVFALRPDGGNYRSSHNFERNILDTDLALLKDDAVGFDDLLWLLEKEQAA